MLNGMNEADVQRILESQFRASLAMLKHAIEKCPEELWTSEAQQNRFWHLAYHALFFTHLYLQPSEASFQPWAKHKPNVQFLGAPPLAPNEPVVIPTPYTREEVAEYLGLCGAEVAVKVPAVPLDADSGFPWLPFSRLEVHLYNIRHIQHHAGQLADRLRNAAGVASPWVRMG